MRIVNVIQGSDEWDNLRRGVPTASNFNRIVTPAKAELSTSWPTYAAELIAEGLKVVVPAPPTFWMEWGTENQPYAFKAYAEVTGREIQEVGFVWPDDHERYGCSPDALVGTDGLVEAKCPKPETLVGYHIAGVLPNEYKPQVQGQLMITNREWCDFVAYHPRLAPFILRVGRDEKYIANMMLALDEFCEKLVELRTKLLGIEKYIDIALTDDYQPVDYQPQEIAL